MTDDIRIPIVEEEAKIFKRSAETERVSIRTLTDEEQVLVRGDITKEHVEVTRVAVGKQVNEAPQIRTDGDLTIVPILEERLVVEKRLFLVEELHVRRISIVEQVEMPATLRRTRVEIEREDLQQQEEIDGRTE